MISSCPTCNTPLIITTDVYGVDYGYCGTCAYYHYLGAQAVAPDDETTDPLGLGGCYKCGKVLCLALDAYHGKDDYAGHLCKDCRYKYERGLR